MKHRCHVPGCSIPCPPKWLTCRSCWAKVPGELRTAVYATLRQRDKGAVNATWAPWWRAQARAIAAVLRTSGNSIAAEKYLTRELAFAGHLDLKGPTAPAGPLI